MPVPETTMDEDYLISRSKHYVRPPWKLFCVKTETIAERVQAPANDHLRLRVARAHFRHSSGSLFRRHGVP